MIKPKHVACIAGARPNFMKISPIMRALEPSKLLRGSVIHTGQHYDENMSSVFFRELGIPAPAYNLEVGSASHGVQTGRIMVAFDELFDEIAPDLVLVVGDVNSTIACALVAHKRGVPVAHVEAGLRSYDQTMPEEINRLLTDQLATYLFTTEAAAEGNLAREGIDRARVHFTGNTMIDTLAHMLPRIEASDVCERNSLPSEYGMVTFHRPSNVDSATTLSRLAAFLLQESLRIPLVFPVHPRTRLTLEANKLWKLLEEQPNIYLLDPLPYTEFLALVRACRFVLTDSGGIQEETTWLGVPCLTQRPNTERPSTIDIGTNTLVGDDYPRTSELLSKILAGTYKKGSRPPLWDGHCAERIVATLEDHLSRD